MSAQNLLAPRNPGDINAFCAIALRAGEREPWQKRTWGATIAPTGGRNQSPMNAAKLSVSLPRSLVGFVETYRKRRGLKSRSQVFEEAVKLLRSRELEAAYSEANSEIDNVWDNAISDGLSDETW